MDKKIEGTKIDWSQSFDELLKNRWDSIEEKEDCEDCKVQIG